MSVTVYFTGLDIKPMQQSGSESKNPTNFLHCGIDVNNNFL